MGKRFWKDSRFGKRFGGSRLMIVVLMCLLTLSLFGAAASAALTCEGKKETARKAWMARVGLGGE